MCLHGFSKITTVAPFEVFHIDQFLALYFSLSSSMIFLVLCVLLPAALFTLTIWPFGPPPPWSLLWWRPHKDLWSEYWCLPLNPSKCEASFFSVDPHQAKLQPELLLLNSHLCFNPTLTYLWVTFDRTLSFSKHVSLLKAKSFLCLKALSCISASSWGPTVECLSLLYKAFLWPLLTYASPRWFPFLRVTNITKLKRLLQVASHAIFGCLSSSLIPLLLSKASLSSLPLTLTHFTLSSYERVLHLPTSFPISGLARLGVKPRLQIVLESFYIHSPAYASFYFP